MESSDFRKRVSEMPELTRVYSESEYNLVESLLAGRTTDSMLDVSAIPQSFIFRASKRLHPVTAFAVLQADLFETVAINLFRDRMPNHCIGSDVTWTTEEAFARR